MRIEGFKLAKPLKPFCWHSRNRRQLALTGIAMGGNHHCDQATDSISKAALEVLAKADAFRSMGLDRRAALWYIQGLGDIMLQMFGQQKDEGVKEDPLALPKMSDAEHMIHDYRTTSLSLKGHPVGFIRQRLDQ